MRGIPAKPEHSIVARRTRPFNLVGANRVILFGPYMPVRLFIGNLPYSATETDLREHLSSVGEPTSVVLPVDRETGRPRGFAFVDYADRAVAEEAIRKFDQQLFKGRGLAVSEARPREERGPGGPRPGGYSGPRPGGPGGFSRPPGGPGGFSRPPGGPSGFSGPRSSGSVGDAGTGTRAKNFGPDAPPKHKRKPQGKERDKPKGPIKQRPISSLYDADEDWRSLDAKEDEIDIDNIATHKDPEPDETEDK
jgi:RNA recognition motif-containing protein